MIYFKWKNVHQLIWSFYFSKKYAQRPHGAWGKIGDRVLMAIKGEKKQGIVVGLRVKHLPGIPRFDTNNVVLIEENGNPTGTRIFAPIPNCIRPKLVKDTHPKKADYTKLLAIGTKFVWISFYALYRLLNNYNKIVGCNYWSFDFFRLQSN